MGGLSRSDSPIDRAVLDLSPERSISELSNVSELVELTVYPVYLS